MARVAPKLTPEQRLAGQVKGLETRRARAAARKESTLRRTFRDSEEWDRLARKYGVELAPWGEAPTPDVMKKYLRRYRVSVKEYLDSFGVGKLADFERLNPTWPSRAFCGLLLENIESGILKKDRVA